MTKPTAKAPTRKERLALLRKLLVSISKAEPTVIDTALSQLDSAIDDYRAYASSIHDDDGRPVPVSVAQTRKELAVLVNALEKSLDVYERLSPVAIALLSGQLNHSERVRAVHLRSTADAAERALLVAKKLPDKQADTHRSVLALKVALVLRDTLRVKPASTRHIPDQHFDDWDRSAAYSRVLEQVATLAIGGSVDLEKFIRAGLKLLKDPELPHNLPS